MTTKNIGETTFEGDFTTEDGIIICLCGSKHFRSNVHMDTNDRAVTKYVCDCCGRNLIVTVKREMPW